MKRKIIPISALFLVFSSLLVYARTRMPESVENVFLFIFKYLPEGIRSESTMAIIYFKFLIWIFVFAAIYSAMKKVMHDNNRLASTAAFVISLSSVILIQNKIILMIFELYSSVIAIVLAILPILLILYFNKKVFPNWGMKEGWSKGVMFIIAAVIILFLASAIAEGGRGAFYSDLAGWMEVAAIACFFLGLIMFLENAGKSVKGDYGSGKESSSSRAAERLGKKSSEDDDDKKATQIEEAEESASIDLTKEEVIKIKEVYEQINKLRLWTKKIEQGGTNNWGEAISIYNTEVDKIQAELNKLIMLDEKMKEYAKSMLDVINNRIKSNDRKKGNYAKIKDQAEADKLKKKEAAQKKVADAIVKAYKKENIIEKNIDKSKKILEETRHLPKIHGAVPAGGTVPTAPVADSEAEKLMGALSELRTAYNRLIKLFDIEKRIFNKIAKIN